MWLRALAYLCTFMPILVNAEGIEEVLGIAWPRHTMHST